MVQILLGIIILCLGFYVFKKYPLKKDNRALVMSALFIVLSVILNRFSMMIPLFGFESLKIGFELLCLMVAGVLVSPSYAFLIGLAVDLMGLLINPTGFPFLGFTLNSILSILIPSLMMVWLKNKTNSQFVKCLRNFMILLSILGISYIFVTNFVIVGEHKIEIEWIHKIIFTIFVIILNILMLVSHQKINQKYSKEYLKIIYSWVSIVLVVEILITFLLTPYWLDVMYGIPFMVSLFIRVIKAFIMIPLDIIIGFLTIRVLIKRN